MDNQKSTATVFHSLSRSQSISVTAIIVFIIVIIVGVGAGYMLSQKSSSKQVATQGSPATAQSIQKGQIYGSNDTATFKDTATGVMTNGGLDGEGQYHLVRPGGDSQNVYMTSSLVDLSIFVGKKVQVWGQTQAAQKVGWLMDVGRVEVLQ